MYGRTPGNREHLRDVTDRVVVFFFHRLTIAKRRGRWCYLRYTRDVDRPEVVRRSAEKTVGVDVDLDC